MIYLLDDNSISTNLNIISIIENVLFIFIYQRIFDIFFFVNTKLVNIFIQTMLSFNYSANKVSGKICGYIPVVYKKQKNKSEII